MRVVATALLDFLAWKIVRISDGGRVGEFHGVDRSCVQPHDLILASLYAVQLVSEPLQRVRVLLAIAA